MIKEKKISVYFLIFLLVLGSSIFIYNDYLCSGVKCYELEVSFFEPAFFAIVSLLPTSIFLLFFSEGIFILWSKHIGWWYLLGVIYFIFFVSSENQSFLSPSHSQVVMFLMAILFVITFVYALVMNRRLKKSNS